MADLVTSESRRYLHGIQNTIISDDDTGVALNVIPADNQLALLESATVTGTLTVYGDFIVSGLAGGAAYSTFPASNVTVVPTGSISSTDAQAALAELDAEKAQLAGTLTNQRVPFANASGFLTDNANFYYIAGTGLRITDATGSTSATTGALVVTGGVGVGGAIYSGGACRFTDSTSSTSTTTGALVVTGGVGIGGALYVGGLINSASTITGSSFSGAGTGLTGDASNLNAGSSGYAKTASCIGDGITRVFIWDGGSVYRTDWQGRQLLYTTARTNHARNSENLGAGATRITVSADAALAPDGTLSADMVSGSSENNSHYIAKSSEASFDIGTQITGSIYVKAGTTDKLKFGLGGAAFGSPGASYAARAYLDFATMTVTSLNGATVGIQNLGDGWYRVWWTASTTAVGTAQWLFYMVDPSGNIIWAGDGTSCYVWGAQLETGSIPTSYIPTTTTAVTVTDYATSGSIATLASAPLAGSLLHGLDAAQQMVSAPMLEADILKALLVKGEVIETPNYTPGSAGVAPVGVKIAGAPFPATLRNGSTLQVNMELGTGASVGGESVQAILDASVYADTLLRSNNRIKNGNSEDPNPTGWGAAWISDSGAYTGTKCRALTVEAGGGGVTVVGEAPCVPGDQFVFNAWGKQSAASDKQYILIEFMNAAGYTTGTTYEAFPASTVYTQAVAFGKAPAGTVKVLFKLYAATSPSATTYYWDYLYAELKFPAVVLSGITVTKTFYAASSSGGSATVLNTVVVKDGIITSWTQA